MDIIFWVYPINTLLIQQSKQTLSQAQQYKQLCYSEYLITKAYQPGIRNMASSIPTTMTTTIPAAPTAINSFLSFIEYHSFTL